MTNMPNSFESIPTGLIDSGHVSAVIFAKQMSPRESLILEGLSIIGDTGIALPALVLGQFFALFSSKCVIITNNDVRLASN